MKIDELYRHLKELAEKMGIAFHEKNIRVPGLNVKSGLCRIEERWHFIMDKNLKTKEKTETLAQALSEFPLEDVYVIPGLREYIEKNKR